MAAAATQVMKERMVIGESLPRGVGTGGSCDALQSRLKLSFYRNLVGRISSLILPIRGSKAALWTTFVNAKVIRSDNEGIRGRQVPRVDCRRLQLWSYADGDDVKQGGLP